VGGPPAERVPGRRGHVAHVRVVRERGQVHDRGAALGRAPDRHGIEQVLAVGQVKPGHLMPLAGEQARDRAAGEAAVPVTRIRIRP
jgi:hypothetical protein